MKLSTARKQSCAREAPECGQVPPKGWPSPCHVNIHFPGVCSIWNARVTKRGAGGERQGEAEARAQAQAEAGRASARRGDDPGKAAGRTLHSALSPGPLRLRPGARGVRDSGSPTRAPAAPPPSPRNLRPKFPPGLGGARARSDGEPLSWPGRRGRAMAPATLPGPQDSGPRDLGAPDSRL